MFSYGSSARTGVGRSGHGGRPYRPPPKRRDPNATPPPLKECNCLIEICAPEYQNTEPLGRQHLCFGGREEMERCQRILRSQYQVHLMVPGKKQIGPMSVISKGLHDAIPALAWLLENINTECDIEGRVYRDVSEGRDSALRGIFPCPMHSQDEGEPSSLPQPFLLFQSPTWVILACRLHFDREDSPENEKEPGQPDDNASPERVAGDSVSAMQTCLDNIVFQLGREAVRKLDIFVDSYQEYAFAVGDPGQADVFRKEITTALFDKAIYLD